MSIVRKLRDDSLQRIVACRALFAHCLNPIGQHTHPGVEAAFLDLFKTWEVFLEESIVLFMRGRPGVGVASVPCAVHAPSDEIARRFIQGQPTSKWAEWTDVEKVQWRLATWFGDNSRPEKSVAANATQLKRMATIRNAIAHSSGHARNQFLKLATTIFGGAPAINRPAELLMHALPSDPARTFFDEYADVLDVAITLIA